jgi:hypothetical protein
VPAAVAVEAAEATDAAAMAEADVIDRSGANEAPATGDPSPTEAVMFHQAAAEDTADSAGAAESTGASGGDSGSDEARSAAPDEAPVFQEAITTEVAADETASAKAPDVPVVFSDQADQSGSSE